MLYIQISYDIVYDIAYAIILYLYIRVSGLRAQGRDLSGPGRAHGMGSASGVRQGPGGEPMDQG